MIAQVSIGTTREFKLRHAVLVYGAVRLTSHPQGFMGLWKSLKNSQHPFPTTFLTDAKETLRQFVERN